MIQERVNFEGWPNCVNLSNGKISLTVTTDVGPRIIHFGFSGSQNLMHVSPSDKGKTGGDQWRIYGGHRLWHAPEVMPRTYFPDNNPVRYSWDGTILKLMQETETTTGMTKEMEISMDAVFNRVTVLHRLINNNQWEIEISPWAITALAAGGRAVLPQEPWLDPSLDLLPSRSIALWHYTQMQDPRWVWGNKFIQLFQDTSLKAEQKAGILNKQGWSAYILEDEVFIKNVPFDPKAQYTDLGCNNEIYTDGTLLEIETLGPVTRLAPREKVEHTEKWMLTKLNEKIRTNDEHSLENALLPLINSFLKA